MSEIAVLGAGIMGHGIALVFALGGHAVRLTDSGAETLRQGARADGLGARDAARRRRGRCLVVRRKARRGGALMREP